jgi:diguanylate cyclase (GGDEF)-like protein
VSSDETSFEARKARLRAAFLAQLQTKVAAARGQLAEMRPGPVESAQLEPLQRLFHTLKGSGASFGCADVAARSAEAEATLLALVSGSRPVDQALLDGLGQTLDALEAVASQTAATEIATRPVQEASAQVRAQPEQGGRPGSAAAEGAELDAGPSAQVSSAQVSSQQLGTLGRLDKLIYLCDDDHATAERLASQLGCFGYTVRPFVSLAALREGLAEQRPAALIMDIMFPGEGQSGTELVGALGRDGESAIPCIFVSARDDFAARLEAVKAGGSAYCSKPVKTTEIVELLDQLTHRQATQPVHVMIIDDDPALADWHALVLEEAGMSTRVVTDPTQVLQQLEDFNADLVLMDIYMPQCSGPELARVLRQMPGHVSLPIIYVSSETDIDLQHRALEVGADGFLTKPVERERLVAEVGLRAERMRTLHALMVRDSLTGLFNHNAIMQWLEVALADAKREQRLVCFAMIDIDHFKSVNDNYGHPTGDQVLLALSRTLRLRLRGGDIVGRYGGEEFAVILRDVNPEEAGELLDRLRIGFSKVVFTAGDDSFQCSFSAGVAGFPTFTSAETLTEAADVALYQAKRAGRNQVQTASPAALAEPSRSTSA